MSDSPSLPARVVPPESGNVIHAFGDEFRFHLTGEDTGGRFTMWTETIPPGGGPPPHYHLNDEEWFYPIEGRVEFFHDGAWSEVPLRTVVFMPRGVVHAFRNPGDTPLRMLIHTSPSGFETFITRCADEFAKPDGPDMKRLIELGVTFGIHFVEP